MVYAARLGSRASTIAVKYLLQWITTARILSTERPDVVFVMTPPVFAALPAFWYAFLRRKQVVLDAHTCAFKLPRWQRWLWLQRMLCRRAATTLVTNDHIAGLVMAAGGDATVVPDVPVVFPGDGHFQRGTAFTVAVVCSFSGDEPLSAMFAAASQLPDIQFYVTGDTTTLSAATARSLAANVTLTGFLSTPDYGRLVTDADVVMDLTTDDHTMLRGAYEAIYQGVPVIVSDWPVLRKAFPRGAVHVDNSAEAIIRAVRTIQSAPAEFRASAERLRQQKIDCWESTRVRILDRLGAAAAISGATGVSEAARARLAGRRSRPPFTTNAAAIRKALEVNGFARARRVFESSDLDEVEEILDAMMLDEGSFAGLVGLRRDLAESVQAGPRQPELSRPTLVSPRLSRSDVYIKCRHLATELLGSRAHCLFNHAIYKMPRSGTETPWHQDLAYLGQFAANIRSLHFWIPLQDTSIESGALRFVPGSHKGPLLSHVKAYERNPHVLEAGARRDATRVVDVPLRRGDVTIHTSVTLHASGPNNTDHIRKAWIIHFGDRSATYKHVTKLHNVIRVGVSSIFPRRIHWSGP